MAPRLLYKGLNHDTLETAVHRRAHRAGFTLIELIMTMAIIAIISAVALPRLDFRTFRVDAAARGLASMLTAAQRQAVTNQSNVNVLFDTVTQAIKIHEDVNNDNIQDPTERVRRYPLGDGVVFGVGSTPTRVYTGGAITFTRRQSGFPELIFRRDGSASESGAAYLTSTNASTNGRTKDGRSIEVILATGRVAWYKYVGTTWVRKF